MPTRPSDFRFTGVDGRGRVNLVQDPRNGGVAVIRIEDPKGGREGYTFDLEWRGGSGYGNGGGYGARNDGTAPGVTGAGTVIATATTIVTGGATAVAVTRIRLPSPVPPITGVGNIAKRTSEDPFGSCDSSAGRPAARMTRGDMTRVGSGLTADVAPILKSAAKEFRLPSATLTVSA